MAVPLILNDTAFLCRIPGFYQFRLLSAFFPPIM